MNIDFNQIVEEVIRRLNKRLKSALIVFTGGGIGFPDAIEQLKLMKADGWSFKVVLSNSAEFVITRQTIEDHLGIKEIYLEREIISLKDLYQDINLLIIPSLTLNTASKIALGIADTAATNMVSHLLTTGTPIIAARDACDLKTPIRRELKMDKAPKAYMDMVDSHLKQMEAYGIHLVKASEIFESASKFSLRLRKGTERQATTRHSVKPFTKFNKKVLSRVTIIEAKSNGYDLIVGNETIVTPLALETAKDLGVKIQHE